MAKKWTVYEAYLKTGDWHVHTNFTDGENTISELCESAEELGIKLIAFTEHVRRNLDYNFNELLSEVDSARKKFNLKILVGCEAKVLDLDGNIDAPRKIIEKCDVVLSGFHSFPEVSKKDYLKTLENLLKNPSVDVWAHPTLYSQRHGIKLTKNEMESIINSCIENQVLIEENIKYNLPKPEFLALTKKLGAKTVVGSDAHKVSELVKR
ncbi:MAG: PHP domain-containing protein [Methanobacteriota archaeon]